MAVDSSCWLANNPVRNESDSGYSRLAHLVGALRGIHNPERTLVAALTFYGDASQDKDGRILIAVGGFLSFEQRWYGFERRWKEALKDAGIKIFHMSEFVSDSGEFAKWKGKQKKKRRFLAKLREIITDSVVYCFGSYAILDDWQQQNREFELARNDFQPYALCGWSTVDRIVRWCKKFAYNPADVTFIFEHGDRYQDNLRHRVERDYGIIIQTEKKGRLKQLESADFAAWQMRNLMVQGMKHGFRRDQLERSLEPWIFEEFKILFSQVQYDHSYFSREVKGPRGSSLDRLCKEYAIPPRTKSLDR